ncbi:MAG: hypothetical protein ABR529_03630 [Actinomycetota bacterium]
MPPESNDRPDEGTLELLAKQVDRYQAIISRLGENSVRVKTWCVTAVGALVAVALNNERPEVLLVGLALLPSFLALDAYYLSLERHFRTASSTLVGGAGTNTVWRDLLEVEGPPRDGRWRRVMSSGTSQAVWPFYAPLGVLLMVGWALA